MGDDDDDLPPVASLAEQVEALKLKTTSGAATFAEAVPVASVTVAETSTSKTKPPVIKKGFFDSKPKTPNAAKKKAATHSAQAADNRDDVPFIKAQKTSEKAIPEFLKLKPDEDAIKYAQAKQQLVDALKPTPDMINTLTQNPELLSGFDDPEVMAAVNEVAQNPQAMKKYAGNPKVVKFYAAMGQFLGSKLEETAKN